MLSFSEDAKEEYVGETGCLVKVRTNFYRQLIRQLQYQQLAVEEHLRAGGDGEFHVFTFFKILQENKSPRNSYEDYFKAEFKLLPNKKTSVGKPPKVAGS